MTTIWERATEKAIDFVKAGEATFQGLTGVFRHLVEEHGELWVLLKRAAHTSDAALRERLYPEIRRRLLAHERAETAELYRELSQHEMTVRLCVGHQDQARHLEAILSELDQLDVTSPEWERAMELLVQTVEQHVFDEEGDYFPRAQSVLGEEAAKAMTERYEARKELELAAL